MMLGAKRILLLFGLLVICQISAQPQQKSDDADDGVVTGSLMELRDKRQVLLIVHHSVVVDTREPAKSIIKEVYQADPKPSHYLIHIYNAIAARLNKYMTRYQSISAVRNISDADFVIYFNLLEVRRPLGYPYPYGEMFVILNDKSSSRQPHIIWKTPKRSMWAEDAINELIRDLKFARGEG